MSGLTTRIGNYCHKLKTFVNKKGFLIGINASKGVRIPEMTSCLIVPTKHDLNKTDPVLYDLEEMVKRRARDYIKTYIEDENGCFFDKDLQQPDFMLDWSGVEISYRKLCYKRIKENDKEFPRVISRTIFKNESKTDQRHTLRVERQLSSVCESYLIEGCTIGLDFEVPFPETGPLGLLSRFSLKCGRGYAGEKILWVFEDSFNVPTNSIMTVSIKSKEQHREYSFTSEIGIKGNVLGTFTYPESQSKREFAIPMRTVMGDCPKLLTKVENEFTYFTITGRGKLKNELEREITINTNQFSKVT